MDVDLEGIGECVKRLEGAYRGGEPLAEDIIKEVENSLRKRKEKD